MKKYKVIYRPTNEPEDTCSVWTYANSKEDAKREIKREYWDVSEIISCYEIR